MGQTRICEKCHLLIDTEGFYLQDKEGYAYHDKCREKDVIYKPINVDKLSPHPSTVAATKPCIQRINELELQIHQLVKVTLKNPYIADLIEKGIISRESYDFLKQTELKYRPPTGECWTEEGISLLKQHGIINEEE